ncbi:MAG TPA: hypothetical protein DDZ80_30475 [Cyanobacteria bacterium UBA8803]|nr:hypothetical protein [Cyanobacteria bacterium UBA9273]HBL62556.1 hypothetical protein [Cyanobacteria bacterium UBA8803]
MRQIRFAAIAFVGLVAAIASSFIDPGTFFHRTLSFTLCSVLGFTSNLCYVNLVRNSGDRAVAAIPPAEQTQNSFPRLDFSPYFQSTRPEFEGSDPTTKPETSNPPSNSSPPPPSPSAPINTPRPRDRTPEPSRLVPGSSGTSNEPCNPTLQTASAQPAKEVIVKGVPTSFTKLAVRVKADGSNDFFPTVARRLDNGDVSVITPLHPIKVAAGGDVQLVISSGNSICSNLSLRIEPLTSAPGAAKQHVAKVEAFVNKINKVFGVNRDQLIGNPSNLSEEVRPLVIVQYLLDHPNNPNSLKAIMAGTAPILNGQQIDMQTFDAVIANSGLNEIMDILFSKITQLLNASNNVVTDSLFVSLSPLKAISIEGSSAKGGSLIPTETHLAANNFLDTTDPNKLAFYCQLSDFGATKDTLEYKTFLYLVNGAITILGIFNPALGLGASIGAFAAGIALKILDGRLPSIVESFDFMIDKPTLDLEENKTGRWNNVVIKTRSKELVIELSDFIDACLIALGAGGLAKTARLEAEAAKAAERAREAQRVYQEAVTAAQGPSRQAGGLTNAAQLDAEVLNTRQLLAQTQTQEYAARQALRTAQLEEDAALGKVKKVLEALDSTFNSTLSYVEKNQPQWRLEPVSYSPVSLYSDSNPSLKYISVDVRSGGAIQKAEGNIYQALSRGQADLVISPKFGSINGACETWDANTRKVGSVEYAKRIVVNDKDDPKPQPQDGETWGDPHLVTFDGIKYDHHAVGEFILAKSTDGNFEIQVREASVPSSSQVALNTAAAMKVGNTRVAFYVKDFPDSDTTNPLRVDGKPTVIQGGSLSLPGGGTITQVNQGSYIVEWTTGERVGVKVDNFGSSALLDINPALPQTRQGQIIGLLGNFNGNPDDDLKSRDGKVLPPQSTINQVSQITQNLTNWVPIPLNQVESLFLEQLHKQFGDSWRISQQESLFDYAPGKNTESFTNRAFPNGFQVLRMLLPAQVQAAEAACRQAGVPSERLEGCLFDVGVTGNADFAKVAANALTNIVKDRVQQEIRDRIPVPGGIKIPGIRF